MERFIWLGILEANWLPISEKYSQNLFEILLAFLVMVLSILNVSDIPLLFLFFPN